MAVSNEQIKKFINQFGTLAVNECNRRIAAGLGFILPSVCLAQSALESSWGTAGIMTRANAFFGVKAGGSWTGKVYTADTWEVKDGVAYNTVANFRAYDSPEESMRDYYELTVNASRYSKAVSYGKDPSNWLSARETITALWAAGYATDSLYVNKIMNTINARDLTSIDSKIDGVSYIPDYDSNPDQSFVIKNLLPGGFAITDSGRTISYIPTIERAYASDWETAGPILSSYRFELVDPNGYIENVLIAGLTGETPYLNMIHSGEEIGRNFDKFGFFVVHKPNLTFEDVATIQLNFIAPGHLSDGTEIQKSVLAYFVKIE